MDNDVEQSIISVREDIILTVKYGGMIAISKNSDCEYYVGSEKINEYLNDNRYFIFDGSDSKTISRLISLGLVKFLREMVK